MSMCYDKIITAYIFFFSSGNLGFKLGICIHFNVPILYKKDDFNVAKLTIKAKYRKLVCTQHLKGYRSG